MFLNVVVDLLLYAAFLNDFFQLFAHRPIVDFPEFQLAFGKVLVTLYYLQGYVEQLYLKGGIGLVAFVDYPFLAVHLYNLIRCQFFHIHKAECRETGEHEPMRVWSF